MNYIGEKFWKLTIVSRAPNAVRGGTWIGVCDCGASRVVESSQIERTKKLSCGKTGCARMTHGYRRKTRDQSGEYGIWIGAKARCFNPKEAMFHHYGGRGITMCERWLVFANFVEDMGLRPSSRHSIDRIDNDGNYEPGNCRWATTKEQSNNRSNTIFLEHNGVRKSLDDWARETGIKPATLRGRFNAGWDHGAALTTPVRTIGGAK